MQKHASSLQVGLDWEMTSILAALPVQYSSDVSGAAPMVTNGGVALRRVASPGQGSVKARSRSSLSLVSHGDARSSGPAPERPHNDLQGPGATATADGQPAASDSGSPQSSGMLAGSRGSSADVSIFKQQQPVRRLSPFAADDAQGQVDAVVNAVRTETN